MRVAIIGGGISGLYLAWKLSEKKHDITVFERKKEISNNACSGLFSQRILEFIPESSKLIQNRIDHVLLHFPKKTVKVKFSRDFFVMSHSELDRLVAGLAHRAGAKIILNSNISSVPKEYDRVIGCDGANSFVRKSLRLSEPKYRLGILGFLDNPCSENYVETWPCKNGFTPLEITGQKKKDKKNKSLTGFIWKIPRGKETEYGILANPREAKILLDEFLNKNKIILKRIESKIVPQGFIIPSDPLITLCGDAIGLTKSWSGGGVIWGLTAAGILLKAFPDFLKYKKAMRRFFIPKIILSKVAVKSVYFLGFKMPWFLLKKIRMESDFLVKKGKR